MSFIENLNHPDLEVCRDLDLTNFSTMKLKSHGDLIKVKSKSALIYFIKQACDKKQEYRILGWGANQPLPEFSELPYIKLEFAFDRAVLNEYQPEYLLPASVSMANLTSAAVKLNLDGWEVFSGVPASLGGAVAMNAGTGLGEIGPLVSKVFVITATGEEKAITITKDSFSYRENHILNPGDVIYQVLLKNHGVKIGVAQKIREYLSFRNKTQPMSAWTCGCMFKNAQGERACRAGESLDILGLKGFRYKNLRVSPIHANFMENLGGATLDDVREFIELLSEELIRNFGIKFEPEIKI